MSTALVTGASSGIGHATAARLLERDLIVWGAARRTSSLPSGCRPMAVDLADPASVAAALDAPDGPLAQGTVDALVCCAGYGRFGPVETIGLAEARRQLEVNLLSTVDLVQRILPGMRAAGAGRIVLVSSIAAAFSSPMGAWYHASKAALESVADSLRQEVSGFGVQVSIIQPGPVRTPWHDTALGELAERTAGTAYERMGRATAAYHARSARSGMVSEVAHVVDAIEHAALAPRPRTRYLVGRGARAATLLPHLVPDRTFDRLTARQFGYA